MRLIKGLYEILAFEYIYSQKNAPTYKKLLAGELSQKQVAFAVYFGILYLFAFVFLVYWVEINYLVGKTYSRPFIFALMFGWLLFPYWRSLVGPWLMANKHNIHTQIDWQEKRLSLESRYLPQFPYKRFGLFLNTKYSKSMLNRYVFTSQEWFLIILILSMAAFLVFASLMALYSTKELTLESLLISVFVLILRFFAYLFILYYVFFSQFRFIAITDDAISFNWPVYKKEIRWNEVDRVTSRAYSMMNLNKRVTITIHSVSGQKIEFKDTIENFDELKLELRNHLGHLPKEKVHITEQKGSSMGPWGEV